MVTSLKRMFQFPLLFCESERQPSWSKVQIINSIQNVYFSRKSLNIRRNEWNGKRRTGMKNDHFNRLRMKKFHICSDTEIFIDQRLDANVWGTFKLLTFINIKFNPLDPCYGRFLGSVMVQNVLAGESYNGSYMVQGLFNTIEKCLHRLNTDSIQCP